MMVIGIDGGNNTVITAIEGKEPVIIPTISALYKNYNYGLETAKKSLKNSLDVEIELNCQNAIARRNLGRYYVGDIAKEIESSNVRVRGIGKEKKGDEGLLICMLTSIAVAVIEDQGKDTGKVTQEVKLVTGLPFLQYKNDKEEYAKQFLGHHKVIFRGSYDIEVELNISDVVIEVEGAGALNKLIFDESGDYIYPEDELIDRIILGVEVGEFTSEIIALTFKENDEGKVLPEYKLKLCAGIDRGIANAKQPIIDFLRDKHNTIKDRYDIDRALKRGHKRGVIYLESGEPFNIMEPFGEQLNELAGEISNIISNKIKNSGEKGNIIHTMLYGGGACVLDSKFGNYLRDRIQEVIGGSSSIIDRPHLANALGYLEKAKIVFEG